MANWVGLLTSVVGLLLALVGGSGFAGVGWAAVALGVVVLAWQPIRGLWARHRARRAAPRLRLAGEPYVHPQVLRTPLAPPRNGAFAYVDIESQTARATNVRAQLAVTDASGGCRYGPRAAIWAGAETEGIDIDPGSRGTLNTVWKSFGAKTAYPLTGETIKANPLTWADPRYALEPGAYIIRLQVTADGAQPLTVEFRFDHRGTAAPTVSIRRG